MGIGNGIWKWDLEMGLGNGTWKWDLEMGLQSHQIKKNGGTEVPLPKKGKKKFNTKPNLAVNILILKWINNF